MQATHVVLTGDYAYVTYNVAGSTYLGGVQNKNFPTLLSQAIFTNTDVSAVTYDNGKLYLAEATSDTNFLYPAVIEEIVLQSNTISLNTRRKGISSFVATDIKAYGGKLFASSGSGGPAVGELTVLDAATLNEITSYQFLDARAVNVYSNLITIMQATPARLRVYDGTTNAFVKSITVGGANIADSKSTANVVLSRAFVAAGDEGMKVVSLTTDAVVDSIPRAIVAGLDPSLTVTNAVSVNNDLVFLANGEAGVYVAQAAINLETTSAGNTNLVLLGKMQFGAQQSANFVASSGDILFIAGGLGGLKIVEVAVN